MPESLRFVIDDPSAFPVEMINKIVENSKKYVELTRETVASARETNQRERALRQREILKKEEAHIQEQIELVKKQLAEKGPFIHYLRRNANLLFLSAFMMNYSLKFPFFVAFWEIFNIWLLV